MIHLSSVCIYAGCLYIDWSADHRVISPLLISPIVCTKKLLLISLIVCERKKYLESRFIENIILLPIFHSFISFAYIIFWNSNIIMSFVFWPLLVFIYYKIPPNCLQPLASRPFWLVTHVSQYWLLRDRIQTSLDFPKI